MSKLEANQRVKVTLESSPLFGKTGTVLITRPDGTAWVEIDQDLDLIELARNKVRYSFNSVIIGEDCCEVIKDEMDKGEDVKFLVVQMTDGSTWEIPARVIAEDWARYYTGAAEVDEEERRKLFENEVSYLLANEDELIGWAEEDMDWEKVQEYARMVESPIEWDYHQSWIDGEKRIVSRRERSPLREMTDSLAETIVVR